MRFGVQGIVSKKKRQGRFVAVFPMKPANKRKQIQLKPSLFRLPAVCKTCSLLYSNQNLKVANNGQWSLDLELRTVKAFTNVNPLEKK